MTVRRRCRWSPVAAALAGAASAPWMPAMAQPAGRGPIVALEWIASDSNSCPEAAYVEANIARLLDGATADAPRLRARAVVVRNQSGSWEVDLSTKSATSTGHRSVMAESCRAAADATALILALAVDSERGATGGGADSTPAPPPAAPTPPATPAPAPPPASAAPAPAVPAAHENAVAGASRSRSPIFSVAAHALADFGTLPRLDPGAGVRLGATPPFAPYARLELGASLWAPQTISQASPPLSSRFDLRSFDVAACWVPFRSDWELGACAGAELSWITARGSSSSGTGVGRSSDVLWPVLRGAITGAYRFGARWAIRADVGLGVGLHRPEFRWDGLGAADVQSPAVVTARAAVGLEVRF